ncbi:MAG: class I SAM-dependent methyltransferase, partial [Halothece sp.]
MNSIFPGEVFANTDDFDTGIRQLLPHYDEMLTAIARCLPENSDRILELGCGTGELSLKILQHYPNAQIVAVDYSPRMLSYASSKVDLAGYGQQWRDVELDFGSWANGEASKEIGTNFDACISSLAIHHLSHEMKEKLFRQIRESLNPGGVFWNADPVLPAFSSLKDAYQEAREEWAIRQGTNLTEVRSKIGQSVAYGYSQPDQLETLEEHLEMLKRAGFKSVAV